VKVTAISLPSAPFPGHVGQSTPASAHGADLAPTTGAGDPPGPGVDSGPFATATAAVLRRRLSESARPPTHPELCRAEQAAASASDTPLDANDTPLDADGASIDADGASLIETLSAWRTATGDTAQTSARALDDVHEVLGQLAARARLGDADAVEWLVNAAATGADGRDAASSRALDHLVELMCDPLLPVDVRESLTTCAATLVSVQGDSRKRIVNHVPLELVYLAARSEGPAASRAADVLDATFGDWEEMSVSPQAAGQIHAADRMVSAEEVEVAAKRFGTDLHVQPFGSGTEPSDLPVVRSDGAHFYAKIRCLHEGKLSFLTVDPYQSTEADRHAGEDRDSIVYGRAQGDTPNACGPIVLDLLRSLQIGRGATPPTRDELKIKVHKHFERWNSDAHSAPGRQWAIAGLRATMLAELAPRIAPALNAPVATGVAPRAVDA